MEVENFLHSQNILMGIRMTNKNVYQTKIAQSNFRCSTESILNVHNFVYIRFVGAFFLVANSIINSLHYLWIRCIYSEINFTIITYKHLPYIHTYTRKYSLAYTPKTKVSHLFWFRKIYTHFHRISVDFYLLD